jgi:hypothetical protein
MIHTIRNDLRLAYKLVIFGIVMTSVVVTIMAMALLMVIFSG